MSSIGLFPHLLDKNNPLLSYGTVCDSRVILALKNATKKTQLCATAFLENIFNFVFVLVINWKNIIHQTELSILCTGILILNFGALSTNVGIGIFTDTFAQLSTDNELTPSGTVANPSPEEIQMDTNGDGIVDENESQNQPVLTGNNLTTEEIQMDTNGDGIVDENESQNQPVLTGNNLTTEEIQMDTNGDGIVDENESQNQPVLYRQ